MKIFLALIVLNMYCLCTDVSAAQRLNQDLVPFWAGKTGADLSFMLPEIGFPGKADIVKHLLLSDQETIWARRYGLAFEGYFEALSSLTSGTLRKTVTSILAKPPQTSTAKDQTTIALAVILSKRTRGWDPAYTKLLHYEPYWKDYRPDLDSQCLLWLKEATKNPNLELLAVLCSISAMRSASDFDAGRALGEGALKRFPDNPRVWHLTASLYECSLTSVGEQINFFSWQFNRAVEIRENLRKKWPTYYKNSLSLGLDLFHQNKITRAQALCKEALSHPGLNPIQIQIGKGILDNR